MPLPGSGIWLGLREITTVDGTRIIDDGPGLDDLLKAPTEALAVELAWRNARHNIGSPRTTNVPTLPLELMHPKNRHRFTFESVALARISGVETERIGFLEIVRPSLIKSPDGETDLLTRGSIWVEPGTGRLRRAHIECRTADDDRRQWTLEVEFRNHAGLDLIVPTVLREQLYMLDGQGDTRATYSNFRRFTTSARIIPPPVE